MDASHMIDAVLDAATDEYQAIISTERRIKGDKMTVMDFAVATISELLPAVESIGSQAQRQLRRRFGP
jgi:hypothetical protein